MRKFVALWLIVSLSIASVASSLLITPISTQIGPVKDYYALIIGIAGYNNPAVRDLNYADDDAVAFYNTLVHAWNWNPRNIWLLLSQNPAWQFIPPFIPLPGVGPGWVSDPNRTNIEAALKWLETNSTDDDKVLIYYSGHGGQQPDNNPPEETDNLDETIVPMDSAPPVVNDITDDEFRNMISKIKGEIDVILDSCHSGGFAGSGTPANPGGNPVLAEHVALCGEVDDAPEDIGDDVQLKDRTVVLASSKADENSFESANLLLLPPARVLHPWRQPPYQGHGGFTDLLLAGINRMAPGVVEADSPALGMGPGTGAGNGNGQVSIEEAFWYLEALFSIMAIPPIAMFPLPPGVFITDAFHSLPVNLGWTNRCYPEPPSSENFHPEMWDGNGEDTQQTIHQQAFLFTLNLLAVAEKFGPRVDDLLFIVCGSTDAMFSALEFGQIDVADWPLNSYWVNELSQDIDIQLEWYSDTGVKAHRKYYGDWPGEEQYAGKQWLGVVNQAGFGVNSFGTFLNAHPEDFERGGTIRYGFMKDVDILNPIHSWTYWEWQILDKIYDTLIKYDAYSLDVIPWMAKSYTVGTWDEGTKTKITFKLHKNILWHDGKPFTSADVNFTIQYTIDAYSPPPADHSPFWYSMVSSVDHVDTPDDYTVEIYFNALSDYGVHLIGDLPIIPKHVWENIPPEMSSQWGEYETTGKLTGSGPFRFVNRIQGMYILMENNPTYFRKLIRPDFAGLVGGFVQPIPDGKIDICELFALCRSIFQSRPTWDPTWGPAADVNKDGYVNLDDFLEVAVRFGDTGYIDGYPPYYK